MGTIKTKLHDAFNFSSLARWMIPPAKGWYHKSRSGLVSSGLYLPMCVLLIALAISLCISLLNIFFPQYGFVFIFMQTLCAVFGMLFLLLMLGRVQKNLIVPLTHVRHWAITMRGGNLLANIPLPKDKSEFNELAQDINDLSESLRKLTRNMKEQVRIQTQRSAQKSNSLAILYDVATSINQSKDLNELLADFLHTLQSLTKAQAATVRVLTEDKHLKLIAHHGLAKEALQVENKVSLDQCRCGNACKKAIIQTQPIRRCNEINQRPLCTDDSLTMLAVPMMYRDQCLGIYNLYVKQTHLMGKEDLTNLLKTIGQHLGVAIAKNDLENKAKRLALMEERTFLSHELHDSLAQTLVSLKFQTNLLKDSLQKKDDKDCSQELHRLETGIDKANLDLRDLLDHFRVRMDERGLIPALKSLTHTLEKNTSISCYFQDESHGQTLAPNYEVQVLHIVQEALSNVRKHSQAHNARVIIQAQEDQWRIVIEDDGVGIALPKQPSNPGENIGLSIMKERAEHIKASLQIEDEADEGTRVELKFKAKKYHPIER